ncbi:MAG: HD domain-containing phosphohydrolase [Oleiphilaceae bacterium]|nr:HD domain-containing phosphohydrolase [Oleiphilaceae bacterium]
MSDLIKVSPGVLAVGEPLPWPVYDGEGNLLVSQGYVISNERQLDSLYNRGLFFPAPKRHTRFEEDLPEPLRISPFAEFPSLEDRLDPSLNAILAGNPGAPARIQGLARHIDQLCQEDTDACIALVILFAPDSSARSQPLLHALICQLVARQIGMTSAESWRLMSAALTANLALRPLQDKLNRNPAPLNDAQRAIIRKHPQLGESALRKVGVKDSQWLAIVGQHHERGDGSGYPLGLKSEAILDGARILGVAEHFVALITRRAYHRQRTPDQAMREVLSSARDPADREIREALLEALGFFPPGSLVKLANGETAIVTHRPRKHNVPRIKAIVSANGTPFHGGFVRDANEDAFLIQGSATLARMPALNTADLWDYR